MSSSVSLSVEMDPGTVGMMLFVQGVLQLHCALQEIKRIEDEMGQIHEVEVAFKNEAGELIGLKKASDGKMELVAQNCKSASALETMRKVKQTYARLKILNEVKARGYQSVKEEKLANGSVRIVVQKWR